MTPSTPASLQSPVRGGAGLSLVGDVPAVECGPARQPPAHDLRSGEGRGRRVATKAVLAAVLLLTFDDYGACGAPMTHTGVNR